MYERHDTARGVTPPEGRYWLKQRIKSKDNDYVCWRLMPVERGENEVHYSVGCAFDETGHPAHGSVYFPDGTDADVAAVRDLIAAIDAKETPCSTD